MSVVQFYFDAINYLLCKTRRVFAFLFLCRPRAINLFFFKATIWQLHEGFAPQSHCILFHILTNKEALSVNWKRQLKSEEVKVAIVSAEMETENFLLAAETENVGNTVKRLHSL